MPATTSTEPIVGDPAKTLSDSLAAFFRAARRARGRAARLDPKQGLSLAQYHALEPLFEGPCTVGKAAERAGVAPPTATRMLDGLADRGLVERSPDPGDRRAVIVSLTARGRRAAAAKAKELEAARMRLAAAFDEDDQARAARLLHRLAEVIEEL